MYCLYFLLEVLRGGGIIVINLVREYLPVSQVLIRGLDPELIGHLKAQAKRHGHSLEAELRTILGGQIKSEKTVAPVSGKQKRHFKTKNRAQSVTEYFDAIAASLNAKDLENFKALYYGRFHEKLSDELTKEKAISVIVMTAWITYRDAHENIE